MASYLLQREEEDGSFREVLVEFEFNVEGDDYEDGYLTYAGGIELYDISVDGGPDDLSMAEEKEVMEYVQEKLL